MIYCQLDRILWLYVSNACQLSEAGPQNKKKPTKLRVHVLAGQGGADTSAQMPVSADNRSTPKTSFVVCYA